MDENIKYVVNEEYPNKNEDERLTKFLKKIKELEEEINSFSLENIETVILDLKELEYISSAGLRVVLMIHKKMNKLGGQLKLINVNDMILNIFDMTGMSEFLNIQKE